MAGIANAVAIAYASFFGVSEVVVFDARARAHTLSVAMNGYP